MPWILLINEVGLAFRRAASRPELINGGVAFANMSPGLIKRHAENAAARRFSQMAAARGSIVARRRLNRHERTCDVLKVVEAFSSSCGRRACGHRGTLRRAATRSPLVRCGRRSPAGFLWFKICTRQKRHGRTGRPDCITFARDDVTLDIADIAAMIRRTPQCRPQGGDHKFRPVQSPACLPLRRTGPAHRHRTGPCQPGLWQPAAALVLDYAWNELNL